MKFNSKIQSFVIYIALFLAASGCENPTRSPAPPPEQDSTHPWTDRATFSTKYDPLDSMYGHPAFYCYLPGEETIPYDTLRNTHIFGSLLIGDVRGFGGHSSIDFNAKQSSVGTGVFLSGLRMGRGEKGVLEFGKKFPTSFHQQGTYIVRAFEQITGEPRTFQTFIDASGRLFQLIVPGMEEEYRNRLGRWYSVDFREEAISWLLKNFPDPGLLYRDNIPNMGLDIYLPRLLELKCSPHVDDSTYRHSADSGLVVTWEADPMSPNKKVILSLSNLGNTFPAEFGHYFSPPRFRQIPYDVNEPPGISNDYLLGPRRFFIADPRYPNEGGTLVDWVVEVIEQPGTNTYEIPASAWSKFSSGSKVNIRGYRWFDTITYFDNQIWVSLQSDRARCHIRAVCTSYGSVIIQ